MSSYEYDDQDKAIVAERMANRAKLTGPLVGDFIRLPELHPKLPRWDRITHDWGDSMQTGGMNGSFYLCSGGWLSQSGSLDSGLSKDALMPTGETREGRAWIFHHDSAGAGRGVRFMVPFAVWEIKKGADLSGVWMAQCPFTLATVVEPLYPQIWDGYKFRVYGSRASVGYEETSFKTWGEFKVWLDKNELVLPDSYDPSVDSWGVRLTFKGTLSH